MLFVGTSIIHPSTEGVFLLCNILDLLIYSYEDLKAEQIGKILNRKPATIRTQLTRARAMLRDFMKEEDDV